MKVSVVLFDESSGYYDRVDIDYVADVRNFTYVDNDESTCEMHIFDDGIRLLRKSNDHILELNLLKKAYARIITGEGSIEIDVKVVDFIENDDILVMRYIVDDIKREIRIIYRS